MEYHCEQFQPENQKPIKKLLKNRCVKIHSFCWTHDWKIVVNKNLLPRTDGPVPKNLLECIIFCKIWCYDEFRALALAFLSSCKKDVWPQVEGFRVVETRCFGLLAHPTPAGRSSPKKTSHGKQYQSHGTISPTGLSSIQEK